MFPLLGSRQNPSRDLSTQLQDNFDSPLRTPEPQEGYQALMIPASAAGESPRLRSAFSPDLTWMFRTLPHILLQFYLFRGSS